MISLPDNSVVLAIAIAGCSTGGGNGPADPDSSSSDCDPSSSAYVWDLSSDSKDPSSSGKEDLCSSSQNPSSSNQALSSGNNPSSSSSNVQLVSSSSDGKSSSSVYLVSSSSGANPSSSSFYVAISSSSSNPSSSSLAQSSSSSKDWDWLNNIEQGANMNTNANTTAQIGSLLEHCGPYSETHSDFQKYNSSDDAKNAYPVLKAANCVVPVLSKYNGKYYAISSNPTTNDDNAVLAKKFENDGLGYIYKGILECMAREGSSGCSVESIPCGNGKNFIFYRAYAPKPTTAAKNELTDYLVKNNSYCQ